MRVIATDTKSLESQIKRRYTCIDKAGLIYSLINKSPVSTYMLLKKAEKVVSFGSTVGIEAVYWGVPSILLGASLCRNMGCCYIPRSHREAMDMIQRPLKPLPREGALKFGFFCGNEFLRGERLKCFSYALLTFKEYRTPNWLRIFGSVRLTVVIARWLVKYAKYISRARVPYMKRWEIVFQGAVRR